MNEHGDEAVLPIIGVRTLTFGHWHEQSSFQVRRPVPSLPPQTSKVDESILGISNDLDLGNTAENSKLSRHCS